MATSTLPQVTVIQDQLDFGRSQPVTSANLISKLAQGTVLQVSDSDPSKIGTANKWLKVTNKANVTGYVNAAGVQVVPDFNQAQMSSATITGDGTYDTRYIDLSGQPMQTATINTTSGHQKYLDLGGQVPSGEIPDDLV